MTPDDRAASPVPDLDAIERLLDEQDDPDRVLAEGTRLIAHVRALRAEVAAGRALYAVALAWWEAQTVEFPTDQQVDEKEIGSFVKMIDAIEAYQQSTRQEATP